MLFLSSDSRKELIEQRAECKSLVDNVVTEYGIENDCRLIDADDLKYSKSMGTANTMSWLRWMARRVYYGRVKNDWNETIRLYDVPVDELHLDDRHSEQMQEAYACK